MPYGSVTLQPGVNVERTPTVLKTGISQSQLIRFRDGLVQKYGGWKNLFASAFAGVPRELHAWQDLNAVDHLGVGTTQGLSVLTAGQPVTITPRTQTDNVAVNFSTVMTSPTVTIVDSALSVVSAGDTVVINTPIAIGGLVLYGPYVVQSGGSTTYTITAAANATSTVNNAGAVPVFTTSSGSSTVAVAIAAHGLLAIDAPTVVFTAPTTGNGVTIQGGYAVSAIVDANDFDILASTMASGNGSFSMNGGNVQLVYYFTIQPVGVLTGYGAGGYGAGGYGVGGSTTIPGTVITGITDWTSDNWGQIYLACPSNGPVFQWNPISGLQNAGMVGTAPPINGGIFVSQTQQILVCWASTITYTAPFGIGVVQDPLTVRWSNVGDFTNFQVLTTDQAGSFRIPIGSKLMGGMAVANQDLLWTDEDVWAMNYLGAPLVFGFNKIGGGAGAISSHAMLQLRGNVYWMGPSNFYSMTTNGVAVMPCPVWDFVFQNLNTSFVQNVRAMSNTPFNEAGWLFPSAASSNGECDSYVKTNIVEQGAPWDYGSLPRSAWTDENVYGKGNPIGATPTGIVYQHETTNDADGQPMAVSFTTGYFYISEGEDFAFVDQILPDFKWGFFDAGQTAQIQLSFSVVNYPGDTPQAFGPYTVTQATQYIMVRCRGRQMSFTVASNDVGSWWRLGHIRYRFAPSGRR